MSGVGGQVHQRRADFCRHTGLTSVRDRHRDFSASTNLPKDDLMMRQATTRPVAHDLWSLPAGWYRIRSNTRLIVLVKCLSKKERGTQMCVPCTAQRGAFDVHTDHIRGEQRRTANGSDSSGCVTAHARVDSAGLEANALRPERTSEHECVHHGVRLQGHRWFWGNNHVWHTLCAFS